MVNVLRQVKVIFCVFLPKISAFMKSRQVHSSCSIYYDTSLHYTNYYIHLSGNNTLIYASQDSRLVAGACDIFVLLGKCPISILL